MQVILLKDVKAQGKKEDILPELLSAEDQASCRFYQ